jgi:protein AFG1
MASTTTEHTFSRECGDRLKWDVEMGRRDTFVSKHVYTIFCDGRTIPAHSRTCLHRSLPPIIMLRSCRALFVQPSRVYQSHVNMGKLRADPRQQAALRHLDVVYDSIEALCRKGIPPRNLTVTAPPPAGAPGGSATQIQSSGQSNFFSSFVSSAPTAASAPRHGDSVKRSTTAASSGAVHPLSAAKGIYLYGDVGCGKTHLMDMLYAEIPSGVKKRRVHFHQFMQGVHKDMHNVKKIHGKTMDGNQLMREVAVKQVKDAEVLCFDELVVSDVADAMILRRLFDQMYAIGVLAIFTSNRAPEELYKDGLNRGGFLPFIDLVKQRCAVHNMSSQTDHRLAGTTSDTYLYPLTNDNSRQFEQQYRDQIRGTPEGKRVLQVYGRDLIVNRAAGGVCRFTFRELCNNDMGVADYGEIAKSFHTLFLENVPQINAGNSDTKRRFITLLDQLYQHKVKLYVLASAAPDMLERKPEPGSAVSSVHNEESFYAGQLIGSGEDQFQMRRAVSRLHEMRSKEYATQRHIGVAA